MKNNFRIKIRLKLSIACALLFVGYSIMRSSTNITFENNTLDSALDLGFFIVPIIGIYWLTYIKQLLIKIILIALYGLLLLPFYTISSLAILFTANDVFSMNNNGYRPIHEISIEDNRSIIVYRTPDKGALGGDFINVALVKKLGIGLIDRDFSYQIDYRNTNSDSSGTIYFEGKQYHVPPLQQIMWRGDLK